MNSQILAYDFKIKCPINAIYFRNDLLINCAHLYFALCCVVLESLLNASRSLVPSNLRQLNSSSMTWCVCVCTVLLTVSVRLCSSFCRRHPGQY